MENFGMDKIDGVARDGYEKILIKKVRDASKTDMAVALSIGGFSVIPLYGITNGRCDCRKLNCRSPGKHPATRNGLKDTSNDVSVVWQLWQSNPNYNIGLTTGKKNNLTAIDFDQNKGSDDSSKKYLSSYLLDQGIRQYTGNGYHILFKYDEEIKTGTAVFPGIDVRSEAAYIVFATSRHSSNKFYTLSEKFLEMTLEEFTKILKFPPPLNEFLKQALIKGTTDKTDKTMSFPPMDTENVREGGRNSFISRNAWGLTLDGRSKHEIEQLIHKLNFEKCDPPLDSAEVDQILRSAEKGAFKRKENLIQGWGTPEPYLPGVPNLPEFDVSQMPNSLKKFVLEVSSQMQVPAEMVACFTISLFGGIAGRKYTISPKEGASWKVVPNIWCLISAPPGCMKSPVLNAVLKIIEPLEKEYSETFAEEWKKFSVVKEVLEAEISGVKSEIKKLPSEEELKLLQNRLTNLNIRLLDERPKQRRIVINDSTPEKLLMLLKDNERGLILARDEFSGLMEGSKRNGREGETKLFLEAWNGLDSFQQDRVERGTIKVENLCLTLMGGIQPDILKELFDKNLNGTAGDGLLARFQLLVEPRYSKSFTLITSDYNEGLVELQYIAQRMVSFDGFSTRKRLEKDESLLNAYNVRFSPEAQRHFNDHFTKIELRLRDDSNWSSAAFRAHIGKYRKLLPGLALIFFLIDFFSEEEPLSFIEIKYLKFAIWWCEFLECHAVKIYPSESYKINVAEDSLAKKIMNGEIMDEMPVREINRNQWKNLSSADRVSEALKELVSKNWIKIETRATKGAPSRVVRVNPNLFKEKKNV